jgi:hypothetical protein
MKKGVVFTGNKVAVAAASIAAAAVVLLARGELKKKVSREAAQGQFQIQQMEDQVRAETDFDETHIVGLRQKVRRFRERLGDEGTWSRLLSGLGGGWAMEAVTRADREGYTIQYGTFRMKAPMVSDWQAILATVRFAEGLPGVGIGEFEMRAVGDGVQSSLSLVSMVVVVQSRSTKPH